MKLQKELSKKMVAVALASTMFASMLVGCSNKDDNKKETPKTNTSVSTETNNESTSKYAVEKQIYDKTVTNLDKSFDLSENTIRNTSLILLLDILAPEDENGKINAEVISEFKSKIDTDNMMSDFNSFIDVLENTIITTDKFISISDKLPNEETDQKEVLANIENITKNIMELSKDNKNKDQIVSEYDKLYTLFVEEDSIKVDNKEFEVRDLSYSNRAIAQAYARVANNYAKGYVTEAKRDAMDSRTNDQNNKAYIKTKLEILSNYMVEKSETDIAKLFEKEYDALNKYNVSTKEQTKYTIDYLNLNYLDSDKVSNKDKNSTLDDYSDENVNSAIFAIDEITTYNINNQDNLIILSDLLVDNYENSENGKIDSIALDFVQYNSIMLLNTADESTTKDNNPYFKNLYLFFTKQDFVHKTNNGESKVVWQEVSDGTKFMCNEIIVYTLNKLPEVKNIDSYKEMANKNLAQSIQYIQNTISGECEKIDSNEFVKVKE